MKQSTLLFTFLLSFFYYNNSKAQHKISAYAGWTASQTINYQAPVYNEIYAVLHMPYLGFEYEYDYKKLRFSTGLALTTFGRSMSAEKQIALGSTYLNMPIIAGIQFNLKKNWGLTIESGVELGLEIASISSFVIGGDNNKREGNINAILGLETQWKAFRLGSRLQIGLTTFMPWRTWATDKHAGITTYLGYTLWDSKIAKEKRAKRFAKKQADNL
jgi:hypothetical protein